MDRIACAVEPSLLPRHELARAGEDRFPTVGEAMSNAACDIAEVLGAAAILVPTYSGRTASAVARHRPQRPIIARDAQALRPPAAGDRMGSRPGGDRGVRQRRASLEPHARRRARDRPRRARRPGRHHGGHGGERPWHDERDQGRDRLGCLGRKEPWAVEMSAVHGSPQALALEARPPLDRRRGSRGHRGLLHPPADLVPARTAARCATGRRPSRLSSATTPS